MIRMAITARTGRAPVAGKETRREFFIHIEAAVLDHLRAMRRPGESYSDVILPLVEVEAGRDRL
jgi:hypothetical protein